MLMGVPKGHERLVRFCGGILRRGDENLQQILVEILLRHSKDAEVCGVRVIISLKSLDF
jgi:hypothetical protein